MTKTPDFLGGSGNSLGKRHLLKKSQKKKEPEETDENPEAAELLAEIVSEKGSGERDRRIIKSDPELQHLLDDPDIVRVSFDSQGKIEQINNGFIAGVDEKVIRELDRAGYLSLSFRMSNTRNPK